MAPASSPVVSELLVPAYAEVHFGYGNPIRCELSRSEIHTLWEMCQNLEFVSKTEQGDDEAAFIIWFFGEYDAADTTDGRNEAVKWIIYEDDVVFIARPDGSEETYACSSGSIDYAKLAEIYENRRIIKRSEEDLASAFEAARAYCRDNGGIIERLWYDEICSSAEVTYTLSRDRYEGGNLNETNYLILYLNGTWPWEGPKDFQQLGLLRDSESEPWRVYWNGYAPPFVEEGVADDSNIIIEG